MLQSQDKKSSVGSVVMDPNTKRQVSVTVPGQNKPKPTVSGRPTVKADLVSLWVCGGVGWGGGVGGLRLNRSLLT